MKYINRYLLLVFVIIFISCSDDEDIIQPNEDTTYGIRHDRSLTDYENAAASTNQNLPDLASAANLLSSLECFLSYPYNHPKDELAVQTDHQEWTSSKQQQLNL